MKSRVYGITDEVFIVAKAHPCPNRNSTYTGGVASAAYPSILSSRRCLNRSSFVCRCLRCGPMASAHRSSEICSRTSSVPGYPAMNTGRPDLDRFHRSMQSSSAETLADPIEYGMRYLAHCPALPLVRQVYLCLCVTPTTGGESAHHSPQPSRDKPRTNPCRKNAGTSRHGVYSYTATVNVSSLRVTARYSVSRSNGTRPASVINRTRSARRIPCGVVAPAS